MAPRGRANPSRLPSRSQRQQSQHSQASIFAELETTPTSRKSQSPSHAENIGFLESHNEGDDYGLQMSPPSLTEHDSQTRRSSPPQDEDEVHCQWDFEDNDADDDELMPLISSDKSSMEGLPDTVPLPPEAFPADATIELDSTQLIEPSKLIDFSETASTAYRSSPWIGRHAAQPAWKLNDTSPAVMGSSICPVEESLADVPDLLDVDNPCEGEDDGLCEAPPLRNAFQTDVPLLHKEEYKIEERLEMAPPPFPTKKPGLAGGQLAQREETNQNTKQIQKLGGEHMYSPPSSSPKLRALGQKGSGNEARLPLVGGGPPGETTAAPESAMKMTPTTSQKNPSTRKRKQRAKEPLVFDESTQEILEAPPEKKKAPPTRMPIVSALLNSEKGPEPPAPKKQKKRSPKTTTKKATKRVVKTKGNTENNHLVNQPESAANLTLSKKPCEIASQNMGTVINQALPTESCKDSSANENTKSKAIIIPSDSDSDSAQATVESPRETPPIPAPSKKAPAVKSARPKAANPGVKEPGTNSQRRQTTQAEARTGRQRNSLQGTKLAIPVVANAQATNKVTEGCTSNPIVTPVPFDEVKDLLDDLDMSTPGRDNVAAAEPRSTTMQSTPGNEKVIISRDDQVLMIRKKQVLPKAVRNDPRLPLSQVMNGSRSSKSPCEEFHQPSGQTCQKDDAVIENAVEEASIAQKKRVLHNEQAGSIARKRNKSITRTFSISDKGSPIPIVFQNTEEQPVALEQKASQIFNHNNPAYRRVTTASQSDNRKTVHKKTSMFPAARRKIFATSGSTKHGSAGRRTNTDIPTFASDGFEEIERPCHPAPPEQYPPKQMRDLRTQIFASLQKPTRPPSKLEEHTRPTMQNNQTSTERPQPVLRTEPEIAHELHQLIENMVLQLDSKAAAIHNIPITYRTNGVACVEKIQRRFHKESEALAKGAAVDAKEFQITASQARKAIAAGKELRRDTIMSLQRTAEQRKGQYEQAMEKLQALHTLCLGDGHSEAASRYFGA
ncbi:hypothetical protein HJFPF1_06154 [Paramyrothecium foliicola]|nr:hypothetical protein HJFPF1_06154 [Paramyrothecium foliicola]